MKIVGIEVIELRVPVGTAVNLHRFRHAAATTIAIHDPERVLIAKDLLHHRGAASVGRHYNLAASLEASRSYARLLHGLRKYRRRDKE